MNKASERFLRPLGGFCFWGGDPVNTEELKRKLTAILSADVEGYSQLMREDEEATIRTLTSCRTTMTGLIQQYRGRVVKAKKAVGRTCRNVVLAIAAVLLVGGCSSLGPSALKGERINYNLALQQTNDEQMLLNLVRLKYRDTPIFLEVSSISAQLSFEAGIEAGAELKERAPNIFNLGGHTVYSTQPTITYSSLRGDDFIKRFLSPISLDTIMLLYKSGWSLKRILRLCVQRLNDVENAVRASGPTPEKIPEYQEFAKAIDLMRDLQQRKTLDLVYETFPSGERPPRIVLLITEKAWQRSETHQLAEVLGLAKNRKHYPVSYPMIEHKGKKDLELLIVEPRSLLGILFFLSQSVEVPREDVERGKVTITRSETGEAFDWSEVTRDLLRVESQLSVPTQAAVAVLYRGKWFYVDDSDLKSKSTFSLLTQLFALQAGEAKGIAPVLTLPVGR